MPFGCARVERIVLAIVKVCFDVKCRDKSARSCLRAPVRCVGVPGGIAVDVRRTKTGVCRI